MATKRYTLALDDIREYMGRERLTQAEVATLTGISESYLSESLRAGRMVTLSFCIRLQQALPGVRVVEQGDEEVFHPFPPKKRHAEAEV